MSTELPPLIPREILFGNPVRTRPAISPDGKYLAYLAPDDKIVLQVWLRTIGVEDDQVLTADKKRGIHMYAWAYDGEQLIYLQDADGDENFHFHAVNIRSQQVRDLTPFQGVQAQMVAIEPDSPHEILIGLNLEDRRKHDVYRVNLRNGAVELDTENPGNVASWIADAQFQVRAAVAMTPDGGSELLVRETPGSSWDTRRRWGPDDLLGSITGFSLDGTTLYLTDSYGANTRRLVALAIATGEETLLAEDPRYDVGGVLFHRTERFVQAVGFNRERLAWQALDEATAADFDVLAKVRSGDFRVSARDLADQTWLVAYTTDDGPIYYYAYNRNSKTATLLFSHQPELEDLALASMQPISYETRDGLTVHGYLTIPVGLPARGVPTVLLVHGGPWGRDTWGFDPQAQWLANRGYAVLQVNFRGSTGYGKDFTNAGDREWGGTMHNDLVDGVRWIIGEGISDPHQVAIMGGSYGGYATLAGLAFTPEVFAAGVDIVGPSNIISLLRSIPPYWAPMKAMFARRVGDPEQDEEFLTSRSPLYFADRIRAPLLIGQGANDPRVPQAESDQIVAAMRRNDRPVDYIVYADEGHGFLRPENRLHFFAKTEEFLAQHLGGRCEPVGEIAGHSGEVT
ncbi:MAG: S9 family peptidase [Dehalococcoidia bacterium]|nr:S9 family peptidase [Dehalococcoidia bacterium]